MTCATGSQRGIARSIGAVAVAFLVTGVAPTIAAAARADSTPIGSLPPGPVATITTAPSQLVAVALPGAAKNSGLVWRIARQYDSRVVRQISEADVGVNVVLVFQVVGRGNTSLVFALTHGDTSGKAVKAVTHRVRSS